MSNLSPDRESNFCFLLGAGISSGVFPVADEIVNSVLEILLTGKLKRHRKCDGECDKCNRPSMYILMCRDRKNTKKYVRMEYLFQLIKEYLDPNVGFARQVYRTGGKMPLAYHEIFGYLAHLGSHHIFTTNFDNLVEKAFRSSVYLIGEKLQTYYRTSHFVNALQNVPKSVLFKLHGSVHDHRSLAMTFDGIRPGKLDKFSSTTVNIPRNPRWHLLSKSLVEKDLCVVGYGGWDDTDVIPTLIGTKANGKKIVWFFHEPEKSDIFCYGSVFSTDRFKDDIAIPEPLRGSNVDYILKKTIALGNRNPDDITVIIGPTEINLSDFLKNNFNNRVIQNYANMLRISKSTSQNDGSNPHMDLIVEWYNSLPAEKDILRKCLCIEMAYQIGFIDLLGVLGVELHASIDLPPWLRLVVLRALCLVAYWNGNPENVHDYLDEADKIWDDLQATGRSVASGANMADSSLVMCTYLEVNAWFAESIRYYGYARGGVLSNHHDLEALVAEKINKIAEFRIPRLVTGSSTALSHPFKFGLGRQKVIQLRNYWLSSKADMLLGLGSFEKAKRIYVKTLQKCESYGARNQCLVILLGIADCHLYTGHIQVASDLYDEIIMANKLAGWNPWAECHPWFHKIDISRIRHGKNLPEYEKKLGELKQFDEDFSVKEISLVLDWAFTWSGGAAVDHDKIVADYQEMSGWSWMDQDRPSFEILYIEYLLMYNKLTLAKEVCKSTRELVTRDKVGSTIETLDVIDLEIDRRTGRKVYWENIYSKCESKKLALHQCFIICIALANGDCISNELVLKQLNWAVVNKIKWVEDILSTRCFTKLRRRPLPLRFPFMYSQLLFTSDVHLYHRTATAQRRYFFQYYYQSIYQ